MLLANKTIKKTEKVGWRFVLSHLVRVNRYNPLHRQRVIRVKRGLREVCCCKQVVVAFPRAIPV